MSPYLIRNGDATLLRGLNVMLVKDYHLSSMLSDAKVEVAQRRSKPDQVAFLEKCIKVYHPEHKWWLMVDK
jgi:hypothetical protein